VSRDTSAYRDADGVRLPSVTEILRLAGLTNLDAIPESYLERARVRGVDLHEWTAAIDLGLIDADMEPPQQIAGRVRAYLRFLDESQFRVLQMEEPVRHDRLRYCGTFDRYGLFPVRGGGGTATVLELKATVRLYPETRLQLCGYAMALGDPRPERAALQLLPNGTYRLERYRDKSDYDDWIAAVRVANFRLAHGLATIEEDRR
jgi:hypothetical protein